MPEIRISKGLRIIILFCILAIATFFRVWQLKDNPNAPITDPSVPPGLFSDEAMNGSNAHHALRTFGSGEGFQIFYRENNGREGLFMNIQALSMLAFGHTSFALRFMSALFGILTALALYFFVREYTKNEWMAVLASFFIATGFWHIMFSRIGFRAIMAPFFLTAGLAALYWLYNHATDKNHTKLLIVAASGGILYGLGFYSYIAYRASPLLLLPVLYLFIKKALKGSDSCILCIPTLFLFFTFLTALPLGYFFLQNPQDFFGRTSQISVFSLEHPLLEFAKNTGKTLQMFYFVGDSNWRHNLPGRPALWWPVAIFFTVGIFESIRKRYLLLFLWFFTMLLPVAISSEGLPHALRAIIMIPPVFAFAGIGAYQLWSFVQSWLQESQKKHEEAASIIKRLQLIWLPLFAGLILLLIPVEAYRTYFFTWGRAPQTFDAFSGSLYATGVYLKQAPLSTQKYVLTGETDSVDLTGRPMSLQPILYASETSLPDGGDAQNIHYLTLKDINQVSCDPDCIIIPIDHFPEFFTLLKTKIPSLHIDSQTEQDWSLLVLRP